MTASTITFSMLAGLVALALLFDFMNGFHDAANSIATVVSTGVLKPYQAVAWAACFNFVAVFVFQLKVAATVGKGIADPSVIDHYVIFGALVGAIVWNVVTWYYGLPSSSSHALIGGHDRRDHREGGALARCSAPGILKTAAFIVVSPVLGFLLGALLMIGVSWVFFKSTPRRMDRWFRRAAAGVVGALQPRPRQQRRAEDDGHHLAAADRGRRVVDPGRACRRPG